MAPVATSDPLDDWYNGLFSRCVDLVGDYAGEETFLIEGDSMLLHAFSNDKLDFVDGFQLLHAVWIVEQLLKGLWQRRCKFHLIFFDNNCTICVPAKASTENRAKYMLAREVVFAHLDHDDPQSKTPPVSRFSSPNSPEFTGFLDRVGAYFIMCHDGAACKSSQRKRLRRTILHFVSKSYNIALINSLEFRDTKAFAFVVEGHIKATKPLLESTDISDDIVNGDAQNELSASLQDCADVCQRITASPNSKPIHSQRTFLVAATLKYMIETAEHTMLDALKRLVNPLLAQLVLLEQLDLTERRAFSGSMPTSFDAGVQKFHQAARAILTVLARKDVSGLPTMKHDVADFFDGRLFNYVASQWDPQASAIPSWSFNFDQKFEELCREIANLSGHSVPDSTSHPFSRTESINGGREIMKAGAPAQSLMPFTNAVFDPFLEPIKITVTHNPQDGMTLGSNRIFQELTHWHNSKKPLAGKPTALLSEWEKKRALRRNQWLMAEIHDFASSLNNTIGGVLEQQVVFVKSNKTAIERVDASYAGSRTDVTAQTNKKNPKHNSKHRQSGTAAQAIGASRQETLEKKIRAAQSAWASMMTTFDSNKDPMARFFSSQSYLKTLPRAKRELLEPHIRCYQLTCLLSELRCSRETNDRPTVLTFIWYAILQLRSSRSNVTQDLVDYVVKVCKDLGFPKVELQKSAEGSSPSRMLSDISIEKDIRGLLEDPRKFQLSYAGPYLDRNMGSAPDARVSDFEPDQWQRDVLDAIDVRKSLFVVAPTSAGKTFISFYAMKQVLEANDTDVLIYVAPTKALVNQIAAEIQGRYRKTFRHNQGKSVWAIHTRDHRVNDPTGCQILVTVPHVLQIMLLSPTHANTWSPRLKRIIFDEIHCIGQADDGVVWEQLLMMSPCPIIALSATVGNPQEFHSWLQSTQQANGIEVVMIEHRHRYSDLRKYIYYPPEAYVFETFNPPTSSRVEGLGLDGAAGMAFVHPICSVVNKARGMPEDLSLEPRDCLSLWSAMKGNATITYPIDASLDPNTLPPIVRKVDVIEWEQKLKMILKAWIADSNSPFDNVIAELRRLGSNANASASRLKLVTSNRSKWNQTALPLLRTLDRQGALPAIFFNYDRTNCENIAKTLLKDLRDAETAWKESPAWQKKLSEFTKWQSVQQRTQQKSRKVVVASKKQLADDPDAGPSAEEVAQDQRNAESSPWASFDPDAKIDGFHLANSKVVTKFEFQGYRRELLKRDVPQWLIDALERGIGVHHSGMNRKYRLVCEVLFRKGYLRVVIATGTLALGINMPCKTVVFFGDSLYLTALNFRQAAGRAGRRGFDLLGNVVFHGLPESKVARLMSSRLPDLNGHFPLQTTLVLRMFNLLHDSQQSKFAKSTINALLSQPRIYLGGDEAKHTVLHHLRFSIEYLRRNHLLDDTGRIVNFAGVVSHLYFTESSSFAFHALLKAGYFHTVCQGFHSRSESARKDTLEVLMLALSHLFGRQPLRRSMEEKVSELRGRTGSVVILPPLPQEARDFLEAHDKQTLNIYKAYVTSFVTQHLSKRADNVLPLSGFVCGGTLRASDLLPSIAPPPEDSMTSAFAALSGVTSSNINSISDLCGNVRNGVFLEQDVIPYVSTDNVLLNAYLFDFFKHGSVKDLERANMIRKGDMWFVLKDFSLVLATIVTSLNNYLRPDANHDISALDVVDAADRELLDQDTNLAEADVFARDPLSSSTSNPSGLPSLPIVGAEAEGAGPTTIAKRKPAAKVADSWDDELSDDDDSSQLQDEAEVQQTLKNDKGGASPGYDSTFQHQHYASSSSDTGLRAVHAAFCALQREFDEKFKSMWA